METNIAAESEYKYRQIVQRLPAAFYTCDPEGRIRLYNKAAVALWGREPEVGKDLWCGSWRIYKTDGSPLPLDQCPMAIAMKEGRPVYGHEIIIERPDGVRRNVLPHPEPIFDASGNLVEAVNMLVDITEHKRAEQALRESEARYRALLEKEVSDRTLELQDLNRHLEKTNSELEQFAYVASHDLQEPLRKIQTFTDLMESSLDDPEKARLYLSKIGDCSARMTTLIRDLLNFSRLSRSDDPFVNVDLNQVLADTINDLELPIQEKKATVHIAPGLPAIQGVPFQISQLFYNLISNSLKFCHKAVPPVIHIAPVPLSRQELNGQLSADREYIRIDVRDNGIGFPQEYAEQIFTIFQRLHDRQTYTGTGIGLALCKKIVINHKGAIYATAEENKGAVFHVVLPVAQSAR